MHTRQYIIKYWVIRSPDNKTTGIWERKEKHELYSLEVIGREIKAELL